jgi:hypothetical protein
MWLSTVAATGGGAAAVANNSSSNNNHSNKNELESLGNCKGAVPLPTVLNGLPTILGEPLASRLLH